MQHLARLALASSRQMAASPVSRVVVAQQQQQQQLAVRATLLRGFATSSGEYVRATFPLPRNVVRYIIGPKGANIMDIQARAGGRVDVPKSVTDPFGTHEEAQLEGTAEEVDRLKRILAEEVAKYESVARDDSDKRRASGNAGRLFVPLPGWEVEELAVDARFVGLLIGAGGNALKSIEQESKCRIQFSPKSPNEDDRLCRIYGMPSDLPVAKSMIEARVTEISNSDARAASSSQPADRSSGNQEKSRGRKAGPLPTDQEQLVEVPASSIGFLIGKGGQRIFEIQDETGARLDFGREDSRPGVRVVKVWGTSSQIKKATDLIGERVKVFSERERSPRQ